MHGIHHVTAIAGRPTRTLHFYQEVLGLRLIKKTVNFDDPGTYHLYFGDAVGSPGTILTFFPWEHAAPGIEGVGSVHTTEFAVPAASLAYWGRRLADEGVRRAPPSVRFGERRLGFWDEDGVSLAFVGVAGAEEAPGWSGGAVPPEHAVRGIAGITLLLTTAAPTGAVLTDVLGFGEVAREGADVRYRASGGKGGAVDIRVAQGAAPPQMGRGSVHHVAFRAADDAEQGEMAAKLVARHRLTPTAQKDRCYFRSIYFRAPGGVLFEIATDPPGFTVDEPPAALGSSLKLPPFLEPRRAELEAVLPALSRQA
jgi:glyoxalase family protein